MIRNKRSLKFISQALLLSFLFQLISPTTAWALTGGPSQPEVESFQAIGVTDLVDPFTGDFSYNIPLLDVGGYPINLSYSSGITMDQEASWVGLGWNLNPGVINRSMRGIPDEFDGDEIKTEMSMRRNETYTFRGNFGSELFGIDMLPEDFAGISLNQGVTLNYNTFTGVGIDISAGVSLALDFGKSGGSYGTAKLGLNFLGSSENGADFSPSVNYSNKLFQTNVGLSLGASVNSRLGFKGLTNGISLSPPSINFARGNSFYMVNFKLGAGGFTSFLPNTYVPQLQLPYTSGNYGATFKFGGTLFGLDGTFDIGGTYSYQDLMTNQKNSPSYGYTKMEGALNVDNATMDFNRERDGAFDKYTTNLPVTNLTYDLYHLTGQGLSGMFRSYRSDVGYVKDPTVKNTNGSGQLGLEFGVTNLTHDGAGLNVGVVNSESGMWEDHNDAKSMKYEAQSTNDIEERYYFAMVGHRAADLKESGSSVDDWYKDQVHGAAAMRVDLTGSDYDVKASQNFAYANFSTHSFSSINRDHRVKRTQHISSFTIDEMKDYTSAGGYFAGEDDVDNLGSSIAKGHHIGQFAVTKTDGSRYVYGIPVYNYFSKDVSFNVSGRPYNCQTGLVSYQGKDASAENERGQDRFFQAITTPAYAHSYLLSEVLSSDYSDFDNTPGPSSGDLGTYYKFEYNTVDDYKWRVPYGNLKANFDPGMRTKAYDDRGHYSYGEKEIKYLSKIESKTHVAIFHTDASRSDSKGVQGEEGGAGDSPASMHRLTKISLYTLADYEANGASATPIKEVHFEYDYSLCQGVDNNTNTTGKLTLKKVYFTYGNSFKGKANPYYFTYADLDHNGLDDDGANPDYDIKAYDRWGNYSPNNIGGCEASDGPVRADVPYTDQNRSNTDIYTAAWSLTDIQLPSGGIIQVDYEADDYQYVQDKKAQQMVEVLGSGTNTTFNPGLASNYLYVNKTPHQYFYISTAALDGDDDVDSLKTKYFSGIDKDPVHFKFLIQIPNRTSMQVFGNQSEYEQEYISGYLRVEEVGFVPGYGNDYAYIKVEPVKTGDPLNTTADAHPVSVTAWNYTRMNNPDLAYSLRPKNASVNPSGLSANGIEDVFYELYDAFKSFAEFLTGANGGLRIKKQAQRFEIGSSWLRLDVPKSGKLGGGTRVSKVLISDSWNAMAGGLDASYGQEFEYTLSNGKSSGVAAYEPMIGNEENPFRAPVLARKNGSDRFDKEEYLYVPGRYQEGPFGESFFPAPMVGYSRMTIKDIIPENARQHATGKVVKEFYTAKDFPVRVKQTSLEVQHRPPSFLSNFLKFSTKEHMTTGQGYTIVKNDMHGKPKAEWAYAEGQVKPQSGLEYLYRTNGGKLNNEVSMLHKNNSISENFEIGVEYDLVNDFRHFYSTSTSGGLNYNGASFVIPFVPPFAIYLPTIIPSYSRMKTQYRSVVSTKIVNQFGVLNKTLVHNEEATSETENLVWDAETGNVILTKVNDKYDANVYNFSLPAHLPYPQMGGVYKNQGFQLSNVSLSAEYPFIVEGDPFYEMFGPGDEVLIYCNSLESIDRAWIIEGSDSNGDKGYFLIDKNGDPIPSNAAMNSSHSIANNYEDLDNQQVIIHIVSSGRDNQFTNVGSIGLKENPIDETNIYDKSLQIVDRTAIMENVINADVITYSDHWQGTSEIILNEGAPRFKGYEISDDVAVQAANETFLNRLIGYLATSGKLNTSTGANPITETTLLNNSSITASELQDFCMNLWGCGSGGFAPAGIKTLNSSVSDYVEVSVDWKLVENYYSKSPYTIKSAVCEIKIERSGCVGLYMSLVTNLCENEFDITNDEIDNIKSINTIVDVDNLNFSFKQDIGGLFYQTRAYEAEAEQFRTCQIYGELIRSNSSLSPTCNDDRHVFYNYYHYLSLPLNNNFFRVANGDNYGKFGLVRQLRTHKVDVVTTMLPTGFYYNPYVSNARGNWRPKSQYVAFANRSSNAKVREAGEFSLKPFWYFDSQFGWAESPGISWKKASESTKYLPNGENVESKDALGLCTSALVDGDNYVVASGQNMSIGQLLSLDFEPGTTPEHDGLFNSMVNVYFGFRGASSIPSFLNTTQSHTGFQSLRISSGSLTIAEIYYPRFFSKVQLNNPIYQYVYEQRDSEKLNTFFQIESENTESETQEYLVSFWLKAEDGASLTDQSFNLQFNNVGGTGSFVTANNIRKISPMINGWQKVEQILEVQAGSSVDKVMMVFQKSHGAAIYMDDLRIHPSNGLMTSNVYDKVFGRLSAQLDANNYATYYEYDLEGNLVRVKRETERGIQTIQENRQNLVK
ncbi:hypothetical protein [Croceimicrobium hydrocarbonivorans]|uniref:Uncharacterized protein n=1 Tax=Croceimicrobium hydrocarbonivorans TaxID=2761580 RepID=A0A7H0VK61_9FLAO|nr:hypothetical protein [Croceimicrobium hydrocarbonivorans]QNR26109.1 hypothetical protein H4K34_12595 [Croceimicrobium hydrocarbonivorans]